MAINKAAPATRTTKPAPPKPQRVSMNPDTFTHGGLIDDIDVTIVDAMTCMWDYNGQQPEGPALAVQYQDVNGTQHDQYYSVGKAEDWSPEDSGEGFVSVSGKTGINDSTNLGKLLASLIECGFPKEAFDDGNLKVIIGTECHVNQVAQERTGLVRTGKNANRPSTTLLVTKIHQLPEGLGVASAAPARGKPASRPASTPSAKAAVGGKTNGAAKAAPAAVGNDLDESIIQALLGALGDTDPLPKKDMAKVIFTAFSGEPNTVRNKAVSRANNADFLKSLADNGIAFDGATLSMAG